MTESVQMDVSFRAAAENPEFRRRARGVLISEYFPPIEQVALRALVGIDELEAAEVVAAIKNELKEIARNSARDVRFRIEVVSSYLFTCALTGYRLTTAKNSSIVDAAHIHERRDSLNDDPTNGLALSKNAHWMFDEGLWSITDELEIMIAENAFADSSPEGFSLRNYQGRPLYFERESTLRPHPKYLAWHREHRFQAQK